MEVVFPFLSRGSTRDETNLAVIFQIPFSLEGNLQSIHFINSLITLQNFEFLDSRTICFFHFKTYIWLSAVRSYSHETGIKPAARDAVSSEMTGMQQPARTYNAVHKPQTTLNSRAQK